MDAAARPFCLEELQRKTDARTFIWALQGWEKLRIVNSPALSHKPECRRGTANPGLGELGFYLVDTRVESNSMASKLLTLFRFESAAV